MKKTMRFLSMAALALVGAMMTGCSSDDNFIDEPQQPENKSNVVTLTTTVGLDGGATTRALTSGGVKTFAAGETIALVYKKTGGATAVAVSDALKDDGDIASGAKSATFTFTLDDPDKDQNVTYVYPAAMAKADGTINYDALDAQDGTLTSLASNLDLATYTAAWNGTALPNVTLDNQLAILAITLKDNAATPSEITGDITGMTVSDGTNTYTVTRSAVAGPIYVAIQPTTSADIEVTATDGTKNYTKSLTGKTYEAGNGYSVSWRMAEAAAAEGHALSASIVGELVGTDGLAYAAADKDNLPTGVTAVAMVAYKSATTGSSLAIALADEGSMNWATAKSTCEGKDAIGGNSWKLPSQDEWKQMFSANGGSDSSYSGLNTTITNAGGTALQETLYWSSAEYDEDYAYVVFLYGGAASFYYDRKDYDHYLVRSCLAF